MTIHKSARRTLLVGTGSVVENLLHETNFLSNGHHKLIGVVALNNPAIEERFELPVLGQLEDLPQIVELHRPQLIVVGRFDEVLGRERRGKDRTGRFNHFLLEASLLRGIRVELAADAYEKLTGKLPIEAYAPEDMLHGTIYRPKRPYDFLTRTINTLTSLFAVMMLAPLMALIAIMVKLDSSGPILFIQKRLGIHGREFNLLKFRTMTHTEDQHSLWESDNAHRITRIGRWLRKFRLDELPQLINVVLGDMNLVGPRPHPASNYKLFALASRNTPESGNEIPFYYLRCLVAPGITGWAQVRYRYANNLDEEIEKLRYDLFYIKHRSLWLDIKILISTVGTVVMGHSATDLSPTKAVISTPKLQVEKKTPNRDPEPAPARAAAKVDASTYARS